eukprot:CAMPEP_0184864512 /NCGR_PEP_ID=MMETSP0580-20130426/15237_1 /TAXON_ID=1118495 /ORGANISM="Dactyliosolen fragilissimus" /LENGTH=797 /DNA_ID=CAMNT_0027363341 /DNA_START=34 /DNA_END=2427 /DNA_ORIENTATION=+
MGKKSASKKGPKGKKARQKAKLDRQWGELVDEDKIKAAKVRKGKRRLLNTPSRIHNIPKQQHQERELDDNVGFGPTNWANPSNLKIDKNMSDYSSYSSTTDDESENGADYDNNDGGNKSSLNLLLSKIGKNTLFSDAMDKVKNHEENDDDDSLTIHSDQEMEDGEFLETNTIEVNNPFGHFSNHAGDNGEGDPGILPPSPIKVQSLNLNSNIELSIPQNLHEEWKNSAMTAGNNKVIDWKQLSVAFNRYLNKTLSDRWRYLNNKHLSQKIEEPNNPTSRNKIHLMTPFQSTIYSSLMCYADIQISCARRQNEHAISNLMALHILNHVLTSNEIISSNNNQLRELGIEEGKETKGRDSLDGRDDDKWRDQGYTRPKVLILTPTRGTCFNFVQKLITLLDDQPDMVENLERFEEEYGNQMDDENDIEERRKKILDMKGPDWQEIFGDGVNSDDDFKIGLQISSADMDKKKKKKNMKKHLKLFSEFYHSDLIIASPLGLKIALTDNEDADRDMDFLSSIEICLVEKCDILMMQNWDHVNTVLQCLNQQPKRTNRTDFSRVRHYFLSGHGSSWRQLIFTSRFEDPFINASFKRNSKCRVGVTNMRSRISVDEASICKIQISLRQTFQRIPCDSISSQGNDRISYFSDKVLPKLLGTRQKNTLVFIPSYFDFISVRNLLLKREASFVSITEYARVSEVSRGRARFLQGRKNIMLYTGRAHFFLRHHIKGAKHLILYGVPEHSEFYYGLVNMLSNDSNSDDDESLSCLTLFTKYDSHALSRLVGTDNCAKMIRGEKNTYYNIS